MFTPSEQYIIWGYKLSSSFKNEKAFAFGMTLKFENVFNFIRRFTIGSNKVKFLKCEKLGELKKPDLEICRHP